MVASPAGTGKDRSGPPDTMTRHIDDYALLGDTRSAALVSTGGSVDWCCFPRFDSGACFAALLGTSDNGYWSLRPDGEHHSRRRYLPDALVLETTHTTPTGSVAVTDALVPGGPDHHLVRLVSGLDGRVRMRTEILVRFDYGAVVPWVRHDETWEATAGPETVVLRTPVALSAEDLTTVGDFEIGAGERIGFDLTWHPSFETRPEAIDPAEAIDATVRWWREWSAQLGYEGLAVESVEHSLRVLKALTYEPTGAIVAAPTTSLPEQVGGSRNWDYRYCWLRDSTMALLALTEAGCLDEADAWRRWLVRAVAGDPDQLQIVYGVAGERRLPELELPWLPGFEGSRPVRIGNAAAGQRQLDVVGEVFDAFHHARRAGIAADDDAWDVQLALLRWLEDRWRTPDHGIWEVRSGPAHFTFSKVMAWVAFDRAVRTAEEFGLPGDVDRWRAERDRIHTEVCARAVDARGRFVQAYDRQRLDAACLVIPLVGFLPAEDPRVVATVEAIASELTVGGLVRRYDGGDGVDGGEGAFLLCSFWLVDCLALLGRHDEARTLFDRLLGLANDVGLLAEEFDPAAGVQTGNFPQALSHLALVSSAMMLSSSHTGPNRSRSARGS